MHAACCGPNMWTATAGSSSVNINGKPAHRLNDAQQHCGGDGKLNQGSSDVIVGDAGGGGGGSGGSGGSSSSAAGSGSAGSGSQSSTSNAQSSSGSAGSSSSNQSQSPASNAKNAAPGQNANQQPQKAAAQWKTVWSDDQSSVGGVKSQFDGPGGSKELDGGSNSVPGLPQDAAYSVALIGNVTITGKVTDSDGKGVANAKVHIERAFGEDLDVETDSSGTWKAEGFVKDEPYNAHVVSVKTKAEGTLVDENEKPMAGVKAILRGDAGTVKHFVSDAQGKYSVEGLLPNEGYHVEIVDTGAKRR